MIVKRSDVENIVNRYNAIKDRVQFYPNCPNRVRVPSPTDCIQNTPANCFKNTNCGQLDTADTSTLSEPLFTTATLENMKVCLNKMEKMFSFNCNCLSNMDCCQDCQAQTCQSECKVACQSCQSCERCQSQCYNCYES